MKKTTSSALAFLLIFNQFPGMSFAGNGDQNIQRDPLAGYQSVQTVADAEQQENKPDYRPLVTHADQSDEYDLQNISPVTSTTARDRDEYSFEDGIAQFSPDYASAVVVNKIEAADLEKLLSLNQEVGITVVSGKIVMFTSGSKDEINVIPAAKALLEQSSILIHTHPEGERTGPSLTDLQEAGTQTEYVVTAAGVYAYNHDGLISQEPLSDRQLVSLIETAQAPKASSKEARDTLNKFITAIDEYNQNREISQPLRSADPLTVFARTPNVGAFGTNTASPVTAMGYHAVYLSNNSFQVDYDVTPAGAYAGAFLNFDNYATSFPTETINLSTATQIVFNVNSNNTGCVSGKCFKMEFKDIIGRTAAINIDHYGEVNITGANLAYIKSLIDMTQLQTIVFVVEHDNTSLPAGYIQVTIGNNTLPYVPAITSNTAITSSNANLAFKDAVNFSSASPAATSTLTKVNSSEYNLQFNVPTDGSYVGGITTFDDFGTAAIETADLSGLASFDLGLKLSAAGSLSVVLELEDINGNKDTVLLTGVSMTQRYWRVALSNFDNPLLDKTKIKGINAVVVYSNASVKSNTLNVQLGSYAFVPAVAPNISVTSATTNLPFKDAVGFSSLISFAGPGLTPVSGGSLTKKTDREYDINFNLGMAGSYAGGITTFDDFATVAVETANLSTLATLDLGLKLSVGSGSVVLEMEDINGNKDTVLLTGVDTTQRYWRVALSSFDNPLLDKTKIRGINVVASESNINMPTPAGAVVTTPGTVSVVLGATKSGTLNVQLGSYAFTPSVTPTAQVVTDLSALKPVAVALQPCGQNHNPCLPADGLLSTVQNFIQTSANQVNFDFNLNNGVTGTNDFRRYAGAQILFDENRRLSIPAGGLVLGVSSTSVSSYKIELIDNQNRKATLNSFVVNGNLLITRQMIQDAKVAGFDMDHIAAIVFVLDQQSQTTGHMSIQSQGFAFTPTVSGTAFSQAALDNFNQLFNLNTFKGTSATGNNNAAITANAISGNEFDLNFNLPDADDYTGVTFAGGGFDNSSLVPKSITISAVGGNLQITAAGAAGAFYQLEYSTDLTTWKVAKNNLQVNGSNQLVVVDDGTIVTPEGVILPHPFQGGVAHRFYRYALTPGQLGVFVGQTANVGSSLTVGIEGPAGKQMKLEIRDITGKQYDAFLNLTGAPQNYVIDLSASGLDTAHIAMINFVEEQNRSGNSGVIKVFANNIQYNPVISPNSGVTSATTTLGLKDAVSFASIVPAATSTLTKLSPMEYNLAFNVTAKDSYAGSINTFDDFGTNPNKEFSDLSALANLDIGLALSAGTGSVVLELEDVNGNKDTVTLTGVDTTQRYWRVALSSFDNPLLDKTKIRGINVVIVDSNASTKSNALNVKLGSFAFTINVNNNPALTAGDVSHLAFKDIVGFDKDGTGTAVKGDLTKQSSSLSTLSYDISQAASFAGAISTFDDYSTVGKEFKDLSAAGNVTLGLKLGAGQTGDLKLELEDSTGAKSFVILTGITATEKFYRVALSSFTGIDLTKITGINLVAETGKITNVGVLTIRLGDFISVINADPALTTGDITRLGFKDIVGFDSDGAGTAVTGVVTKQAPTLSTLTYNVTPANSFAGVISTFDDFSTVGKEFLNMTSAGSVTLGLKLGSGQTGDVKLELEDATGAKSFVILSNITSTEKIYRVQLASFLGIDITKIVGVNLVLENGKITNTGALQIRLGDFIPVIGNDPALTAGDVSHLAFKDIVGFDKDGTGTAVKGDLTKQSSSLSTLSYDISQAASFAGAISTFDDYSTVGKEFKDLSAAGNVTLGLKLGAGQTGDLKLELEDSTGAKSFVILTGITATEKFYRVALSSFTGIDLTKITGINLVAETGKITNVGVLTIRLGDFISVINADPALTTGDITRLGFKDIVGFDSDGAGPAVTGAVTKQAPTLSTLTYNVTPANSFAGAISTFDDFSTVGKEFLNMTAAGSVTLGLKLGSGQTGDVKLELEDATGAKSFVILSNITSTEKIYRVQLVSFLGIDITKIVGVNLVLENGKITNTGALQIRLGDFIPVIGNDPALTAGDISHFNFKDIVGFDKDGTGTAVKGDLTKQSSSLSTLSYDISQAASFAGAISTFDDYSTVGKEFKDLSAAGNVTLGLKLGAGQSGDLKLELEDSTGAKSFVILTGITSTEKFYRVALSSFTGIDLTKITGINLVAETGKITNVGVLTIRLGDFISAISSNPVLTAADISSFPFANIFGFDQDGIGTAVTGVVTKQSNALATLTYNIAVANSYAAAAGSFDNPSTGSFESYDLSAAGSITLGLKLGAGQTGDVKLELQSLGVPKSYVILSNVTDVEKFYRIQLSSFAGSDLTKVTSFSLVVENGKVPNTGALQIRLGDFTPVIAAETTVGTFFSHLDFNDIVTFDSDGAAALVTANVTKIKNDNSLVTYNVGQANSYAGAIASFDDFNTVAKETMDFSSPSAPLVLKLQLGAGQSGNVKLEIQDINGAKSTVILSNVTDVEKDYVVFTNVFSGVDLTKITNFTFVLENGKISSVGALQIHLGNFFLAIAADATLTTADISHLQFVNQFGFDSDAAATDTLGDLTRINNSLSSLAYKITTQFSYAGVISTFDDSSTAGKEFKDMSSLGSVTLGMKLGAGQTGKVKLEIEDSTGAKSAVFLSNVSDIEKIYRMQLSNFVGIDLTHIVGMNLVLLNAKITNQGTLQIRLGDFIPVIGNDPTLTAGDISHLAFKDIVGFDKDGTGTAVKGDLTKQSSSLSTLSYDISQAASFAGAISTFDDYSTVGKEFKDLSAAGNVTLGLKLGAGQSGDLKLELEDSTGAKSFVMLAGITATEKFYRVVLSSFTGIDLTKITGINLVAETGKITNVGVLTIRLGDFISVINADPALTTGDITRLGFKDIVGFDSDGAGTAVTGAVTKQAPTLSMLTYNVTPANSFAGVISTFDDFSTVGKEFLNMTAAGSVTLGLKLGSGQTGDVKLELEDATGAKSFVTLSNITSTEKIYRVQLASFLGIDITKIVGVNLVLENGKITNTGALQIRLGDFIPVIGNDPALTAGDVSHLAFKDIVGFDKDGVGIVNKQSSVLSTLTYNVANPASYAGAISAFDDFSTAGKEFADLSAAGSITLGLKLGTTGQTGAVKLELQDAAGGKSYVVLSSLADVEKFYRVQLSNYTGVDLTKIVAINLVLENGKITNAGTLQIRFGNFPLFGANVAPVSPYNSALTQLASQPALTAGGGNTQTGSLAGTAQATALSTTELEYEYNLQGNATAFAFARLGNVDNSTFTLPQQVILAARGSQGALTKVEIKDQSGKTVSYLLALDVDYKNFTLDLSLAPAGFDRTQVKEIVFVQDNNFKSGLPTDLVQIQIKGIQYTAPALDAAQIQLKNTLVAQGLDYFKTGAGLDPATHLPYDQIGQKLTQPTLIGFYLQMLAESIKGSLNNGMTTAQALTEINFVMDQILSLQQNYGWKGLLTWMNLDPVSIALPSYNFIDNGNLSMSLAVMTGTLESVDLTGANATLAAQIAAKTNTFLKNQKPGYVDLATQRFGLFAQGFNTATGTYDAWVNRIAIEFRPAIAFLKVYYGNVIPDTVWDNILPNSGHEFFYAPDYIDRNGQTITNMASWDGGAFQLFWPQLFVRESDFIGTRNALYNGLLTYLDYSYQNHIPGIVSASQVPGEGYSGANGILSIAESPIHSSGGLLSDTGSTYALAAAYSINPALVMTWLKGIGDQLNVEGLYGFFDAARSNSEVVQSFVGIDVASALLGLAGTGPAGFKMFLRNRDLEHNFNQLYDNFSRALTTVIPKTNAVAASIPEFADKSFSVFSHTNAEGPLNNLQPADVTLFSTQDYFQGFKFKFGDLTPSGGWGGHYWTMDQNYDATSNELVIEYSAKDSPQQIRVEIKDSADQILFTQIVTIQQKDFQTARVFLPNQSVLQNAKRVVVVIDQNATGDHSAEFTINNMHFIHVPSSQNLKPEPGLGAADVTTLPAGGVVNLVSSNGGSTLSLPAPNYYKLNFNLTQDFFAGISINFDPANTGSTVDLSTFSQIVFGAQSAKARTLKLEFEDNTGHKSTQYVTNVNVSENYYKFLKTFLGGSVDLAHVKNVNVIVDSSSVQPGDEVGDFSVEIKKA